MTYARLVRFYGIDVLKTPAWALSVLSRSVDALRYEEAQFAAVAARAAGMQQAGWEAMMARFQAEAAPHRDRELAVAATDAARAWFIANGIPIA